MKTISSIAKKTGLMAMSALMAVLVALPAFAVENTTDETSTSVCTRISNLSSTGRSSVSEKRSGLQTDFSNRLTRLSTKQTGIDTKIADGRTAVTTRFEDKVKTLEAKDGLTDEQKAAIATFKTGVEDAMTVRRMAVDDARSTYRTALVSQISTQQQSLSSAVTTYQAAVSAAFATAVANCTQSNSAATMATLKAALKTAREALNAAKTPDASKAAIQTLVQTRNATIKAANEEFKQTLTTLADTLKTLLEEKTTTDN
jgi:hypothetical protein